MKALIFLVAVALVALAVYAVAPWVTDNSDAYSFPSVTGMSVSNQNNTFGLGATNIFEVRKTNSAALGVAFGVRTNGIVDISGTFNVSGDTISSAEYNTTSSVSNNNTTIGLGATNIFEVRGTNSAALAPAFNIGTNKTAYFNTRPIVLGKVQGNIADSNAPLTGTGFAGAVQTNASILAVTEGGLVSALIVSNDNRAIGLGVTNVFEIRDTNSAAIQPDFAVGTNHVVYAGTQFQIAGKIVDTAATNAAVFTNDGRALTFNAMIVSNINLATGLGQTNYLVVQDTNSAAIAPDLNVGTNHVVYVGNQLQIAGKIVDTGATNAALFTNSTAPVTLSNVNSKIWSLLLTVKSNVPPALTLDNGDVQFWSSNGSSLFIIKKNQAGQLFTNVLGTAAQ